MCVIFLWCGTTLARDIVGTKSTTLRSIVKINTIFCLQNTKRLVHQNIQSFSLVHMTIYVLTFYNVPHFPEIKFVLEKIPKIKTKLTKQREKSQINKGTLNKQLLAPERKLFCKYTKIVPQRFTLFIIFISS